MPRPGSACLCLLTRACQDGERQVLLGWKKTGFGQGKIVALGGHVEPGETPAAAAVREVKEESGVHVTADALTEAAHITFLFPARPDWDMTVTVFTAAVWSGDPAESDEIAPRWFPVAALPYGGMWQDAPHWLPRLLSGERLRATFSYGPDNETIAEATVAPLG